MPRELIRAPKVPVKSSICMVLMVRRAIMEAREKTPLANRRDTMSHMSTKSCSHTCSFFGFVCVLCGTRVLGVC